MRQHTTVRRAAARRRLLPCLLVAVALLVAALAPMAIAAVAPQPGQRIDLKVLLLSADGKEATFTAWKAALAREGVPYDARIADTEAAFTDATFADYGDNHARYQAVILSTGDLVHQVTNPDGSVSFPSSLADSEWTALAKFELTFGIRRISDATLPALVHGLNPATNTGEQGGNTGQLTAAGLEVFPYLQGAGADRQPVDRRRRLRLPGDAGRADRTGLLPDAAHRSRQLLVPGHLHACRRPRGDGHDRRQQREPDPRPAPAPRHARLGHARRPPRLPAQLPGDAGRRRLPARRALGHDARPDARRWRHHGARTRRSATRTAPSSRAAGSRPRRTPSRRRRARRCRPAARSA